MRALRDDHLLAPVSRVWPFETGFTSSPVPEAGSCVLHAEMWPGIVAVPAGSGIRDRAQVRLMCEWAARHDAAGTLGACFAPPMNTATAAAASTEEGWILGCAGGSAG